MRCNRNATTAATNGRSITVVGDRMVKRQSSIISRLERERSHIGALIGTSCGLFDVPDLLSFDDAAGELVFRFVRGAVPLKTYFAGNPSASLAERCGRALAHIHLADPRDADDNVTWHGDYSMRNLLYVERDDRLTIVDWSNARWAGVPLDRSRGPAGLDIGIAIFSLFHRMIVYGPRISNPELLGRAFLRGYECVRPSFRLSEERPVLSEIHSQWRKYFFARWGVIGTLAVLPSWVRVLRFLWLPEPVFLENE